MLFRYYNALFICLAISLTLSARPVSCQNAAPYRHLARIVELYDQGLYDEAFEETSLQIEENRFCALAYYYRSLIRAEAGDFRRAGLSLKAAFRDSVGFTDAVGLNAYILKNTGDHEEALKEWRKFLNMQGESAENATLDSIVLPHNHQSEMAVVIETKPEPETLAIAPPFAEIPEPVQAEKEIAAIPETPELPDEATPALPVDAAPELQVEASAEFPAELPAEETEIAIEDTGDDGDDNIFPMPAIDFADGMLAIEEEERFEEERALAEITASEMGKPDNSQLKMIVGLALCVLLTLLLIILRRRSLNNLYAPLDEMVEKEEEEGKRQPVYDDTIVDVETKNVELTKSLLTTPFGQSLKAKEDRLKNEREVERLIDKL